MGYMIRGRRGYIEYDSQAKQKVLVGSCMRGRFAREKAFSRSRQIFLSADERKLSHPLEKSQSLRVGLG